MRRLAVPVLFFTTLAGLTLLSADRTGSLKPTAYAITNARVITAPGQVLEKATVVIRDGLIEAVGADVKAPEDAVVIDGAGRTVYPGLIDAGSAWGYDTTAKRSAGGDPAAEDLASDALAATKPDNRKGLTPEFLVRTALKGDEAAAAGWRKAGVTAHLVLPGAGIFAGQSALVSLSDRPARESLLVAHAAQHAAFRGAGFGGGGGGGGGGDYPRALMGLIAHARQALLDAGHHARLRKAFEAAGRKGKRPPADPALEALAEVLEGKVPLVMEADTRDEIDRALDFAAEFKLKPILFGGRDAWKAVDRLARDNVAVILRLDLADETSPLAQARDRGAPARVREARRKERDQEAACASVLARRGVTFAFASQGLSGDRPGERFLANLRRTIGEGRLTADQALAALTTSAAKILGADSQLGTIAKGKAAHLVVADGDWHAARARVREVFVDGVRFDPTAAPVPAGGGGGGLGLEKKGGKGKGKGRPRTDIEPGGETKAKAKEKKKDDPELDPPDATSNDDHASELDEDRKPTLRTGGDVLLRGATVLPVSGPAMARTDILVRKGKITQIGQGIEAPEGVRVIELEGMFVMPGIIDTHCHFAVSGGVNEFSLSVVPEVRVRDVINSEDVQIYRALAGGVTTARLLHGSANVVGGQDAVIKLKFGKSAKELLVTDGPRGVKFALGENVKRSDGRFPNTRMGVEAVLVRAFTEAREYKKAWDAYKKDPKLPEPRRDLRLEALAEVLSGDIKVHCHCYRADEILMLLRVCDRFGVKVASLQHVLEGYKVAAEIAKHGATCSPFSDWWAYKWEAADAIPYCAAVLTEAGVVTCLKSDSNELMRHMYQEAAKIIKYGSLSETDVLKMITLNGARQLGLDKKVGSIEVGKDADLAIFNGHPLNGYARVEMTLVEGEVYFQRDKELRPFAAAAAGPAPTLKKPLQLPRDGSRVLLYGATIHPVSGPKIEKGAIEIENGKVVAVRQMSDADRKGEGALDVTGLHIYPGMIDAGSVIGLVEVDSSRETRDHAEGGDFQPDLRASTAINPDSELIPVTRANGVTAVVTRPTGGVIAGQSALIYLDGWVPKQMAVRDPLALHVELPGGTPGIGRGSPFGLAAGGVARRAREAKFRQLKDLFAQALVYDKARRQPNARTPANPRLEALVPYAKGEKPVVIQASRKDGIRDALKLAEELKIKMILSGGIEAWKVADELKKREVPVILGPVLALPSEQYDPYDATFSCAAKLHKAGVKFCIRSNGDSNTRNLPYHAAMAVSYGLPADEGLKAVTLYPAQILGVADVVGSIEKDRPANLVIATGDLLQASTQVAGLFIGGRPVAPASKHTRLYERYRERLKQVKEGKAPLGTE